MASFRFLLLAVSIAWIAADDSCPNAAEISPCTCDGEGFHCMGALTLNEVKRAFKAEFNYTYVRSIWIQGTPITEIPEGIFGNVESHQFYIQRNDITSVDLNAFSASMYTMNILSLYGNKLEKIDYTALFEYRNLETLNLGRNRITSIPASAFISDSIRTIILAQNQITSIGTHAFSYLRNLGELEMSFNQLTTLGPMSLAMRFHLIQLVINLSSNKISNVSSSAFQGTEPMMVYFTQNQLKSLPREAFASLVTKIGQKKGFMDLSENPLTCKSCDYSWLVLNKDILNDLLTGFKCEDGKSLQDITRANIECSK